MDQWHMMKHTQKLLLQKNPYGNILKNYVKNRDGITEYTPHTIGGKTTNTGIIKITPAKNQFSICSPASLWKSNEPSYAAVEKEIENRTGVHRFLDTAKEKFLYHYYSPLLTAEEAEEIINNNT